MLESSKSSTGLAQGGQRNLGPHYNLVRIMYIMLNMVLDLIDLCSLANCTLSSPSVLPGPLFGPGLAGINLYISHILVTH